MSQNNANHLQHCFVRLCVPLIPVETLDKLQTVLLTSGRFLSKFVSRQKLLLFSVLLYCSSQVEQNTSVNLYKYVFPPDLETPSSLTGPTLGVIGLVQPVGSTIPIAEMQSRWVTRVFTVSLPSGGRARILLRRRGEPSAILRLENVTSTCERFGVWWRKMKGGRAQALKCLKEGRRGQVPIHAFWIHSCIVSSWFDMCVCVCVRVCLCLTVFRRSFTAKVRVAKPRGDVGGHPAEEDADAAEICRVAETHAPSGLHSLHGRDRLPRRVPTRLW